MFCSQCGKEIKDDSIFCAKCGCRLIDEPAVRNDEPTSYTSSRSMEREATRSSEPIAPKHSRGINKSVLTAIVVIIVVVFGVVIAGYFISNAQQSSFERFGYVKDSEFHSALQDTVSYSAYCDNIDYDVGNNGSTVFLVYDGVVYIYAKFEDNEDATECFDEWYRAFVDSCSIESFDGQFSYEVQEEGDRYTGYLLLNGNLPNTMDFLFSESLPGPSSLYQQWITDSVYGGIYLKKDVVIIVYTMDGTKEKKETIDDFLDELELPVPPKR